MGWTAADWRARGAAILLAVLLLSSAAALVPGDAAQARGSNVKYSICHRTNAVKNPYRRISVAWGALPAHVGHSGPVFNLADPDSNKTTKWGDVFSHKKNNTTGMGANLREINWPAGQAIFEGATFTYDAITRQACRTMATTEFIRSEHDAGTSLLAIMMDLDEQQAAEDLPLRTALGKTFTAWFNEDPNRSLDDLMGQLDLLTPSAATSAATSITTTSAVLGGTVDTKGTTADLFFDHGTHAALTGSVSSAATPASVSAGGATAVSLTLTGLSPDTTYYFRLVASITSGSGDSATEEDVVGAIRSFTTAPVDAPPPSDTPTGAPTVTSETLTAGEVGQSYEAQLAATGGTTPYESWTATPLPDGLQLDAATGAITGTPTAAGTTEVDVSVAGANGARSATATLALTILPEPAPPTKSERTLSLDVDEPAREPGQVATFSTSPSAGAGTVTFTVTGGGAACVLDGAQLTADSDVTCTVTAAIGEDDEYSAATSSAAEVVFATPDPDVPNNEIEFAGLNDRTVGDAAFTVSASASSGLSVGFTSATPQVCSVTGSTVTPLASGVCQITASQPGGALPGGGTAPAAVPVSRSFNVVKQANVLDFPSPDDRTSAAAPFTVAVTASSGLPAVLTSQTPEVCTVDDLTVTVLAAGTCALVAAQPGNATFSPAQTVSRTFQVSAAPVEDEGTPPATEDPEPITNDPHPPTTTNPRPPTTNNPRPPTTGNPKPPTPEDPRPPTTDNPRPPTTDEPTTDNPRPPTTDEPTTSNPRPPTTNQPRPPSTGTPPHATGNGPTAGGGSPRLPAPPIAHGSITTSTPVGITQDRRAATTTIADPAPKARRTATELPRGVEETPTSASTARTPSTPAPPTSDDSIDLGGGPRATSGRDDDSAARRSLFGLQREALRGFDPSRSASVEVIGSRTTGQFLLSSLDTVDVPAIAAALQESIPRNATEFAWLDDVTVGEAPAATALLARIDRDRVRAFEAAGLPAPEVLSSADVAAGRFWLHVEGAVDGYRPGSTVYLAVTSDPLLIAQATVGRDGRAQVEGSFPLEHIGAGGHRIRLVGTRSLGGVTVDEQGEVRLARSTVTQIRRFDAGTQATVTVVGANTTGGEHTAVRIVPLKLRSPWWTLLVVAVVILAVALRRRRGHVSTHRRMALATGLVVASSGPALILGWLAITYPVMAWGAVLALLGVAVVRVVRPRRRDEDATPASESDELLALTV